MMSSAATHSTSMGLRPSQNSPISKPRAVYSIDQILGTHHHHHHNHQHNHLRRNNGNKL